MTQNDFKKLASAIHNRDQWRHLELMKPRLLGIEPFRETYFVPELGSGSSEKWLESVGPFQL